MATDEFLIFCERVGKEKKGWFPKGKTSVMLMDWDLDSGVGRCKINRPAGGSPNFFLLHRDEVNSGIRACRHQRRLINTGELRRANIRGWAASPLYGLLKLYFDQVGFSR